MKKQGGRGSNRRLGTRTTVDLAGIALPRVRSPSMKKTVIIVLKAVPAIIGAITAITFVFTVCVLVAVIVFWIWFLWGFRGGTAL